MHKIVFMKQLFIIASVICIVTGCKKNDGANPAPGEPDIIGKWKMVFLKDNTSNTITYEPTDPKHGYGGMTFSYIDSVTLYMDGMTTFNDVLGNYTLKKNENLLSLIPGTGFKYQLGETAWEELFTNNIFWVKNYFFHSNDSLFLVTDKNKTMAFLRQ
jgi:hypothetical protein